MKNYCPIHVESRACPGVDICVGIEMSLRCSLPVGATQKWSYLFVSQLLLEVTRRPGQRTSPLLPRVATSSAAYSWYQTCKRCLTLFGMTREDCVFAWAVLGFSGPNWALPRLYWALLVPIGPYEGLTGPYWASLPGGENLSKELFIIDFLWVLNVWILKKLFLHFLNFVHRLHVCRYLIQTLTAGLGRRKLFLLPRVSWKLGRASVRATYLYRWWLCLGLGRAGREVATPRRTADTRIMNLEHGMLHIFPNLIMVFSQSCRGWLTRINVFLNATL